VVAHDDLTSTKWSQGTAITVNFIPVDAGAIAQVVLDGTNITTVDTFNSVATLGSYCTPLPWSSGALSKADHTITIIALDPSPAEVAYQSAKNGFKLGQVIFQSFVYVLIFRIGPVGRLTASGGLATPIGAPGHGRN
jgi:hypothetical protein